MYVEIHHNTDDALNETDRALLRALLGEDDAPAAAAAAPSAKKAAAAPAKKAKPDPEPEDEDEDEEAPTKEDAVAKATKMVSNGEAAKVKAALAEVGAKKVSEVPDNKVAKFIALLDD